MSHMRTKIVDDTYILTRFAEYTLKSEKIKIHIQNGKRKRSAKYRQKFFIYYELPLLRVLCSVYTK